MIFQNIPIDNSAVVAEALTVAESARQELAKMHERFESTQIELEQTKAELKAAGAVLAELSYVRAELVDI